MRSNKTILVVDDQVPIRRALELKLSVAGYQVVTAGNGKEAMACINAEQPDAVITDISMPVMNGRQLCEMSNEIKQTRSFLTIIMTARIAANEEDWIADMTDTRFIEKPFSPSGVLDVVDQYLGVGS